jgi:hypothetical protein
MAVSISKAQALALADGFIDSQGAQTAFAPRNTISEVFLIASELVSDAQRNLVTAKKISTGNLSSSIAAVNPTKSGSLVSIDIEMNTYGRFVNKGVKGTRSGSSLAGYRFRNENPSRNMVTAIESWIKQAHITTRNVRKYSPYGRHETKKRSVAQLSRSSAYAISVMVKRKGLKPTGFFDKAVDRAQKKYGDRLGAALRIDLITTFTQ